MKRPEMNTYSALIDGDESGDTTITAESVEEALIEAIDWAEQGDWPEGDCDMQPVAFPRVCSYGAVVKYVDGKTQRSRRRF